MYFLFVLFYALYGCKYVLLPPGVNPIAVNINSKKFPQADSRVKMVVWSGPNPQHTLQMGPKLVLKTLEKLHILTRLSARENFFKK